MNAAKYLLRIETQYLIKNRAIMTISKNNRSNKLRLIKTLKKGGFNFSPTGSFYNNKFSEKK